MRQLAVWPSATVPLVLVLVIAIGVNGFLLSLFDAIYVRLRHEEKYLDIPKENFTLPLHEQVQVALTKLIANQAPELEADSILELIKKTKTSVVDKSDRVIYDKLEALAEEHNSECPRELLEVVKSILAQLRAKRRPFEEFVGFMEKFGKRKLELCSREISLEFNRPVQIAVGSLLKLFRVGRRIRSEAKGEELLEALSRTDMITSRFDIEGMHMVAERHGTKLDSERQQPVLVIRKFLDENCAQLEQHFSQEFDTINLARALGSQVKPSMVFLELNELHRLCLAWRKDRAARIQDNFFLHVAELVRVVPTPRDGQE